VAAYNGDRLQVGNLVFEVKIDEGEDKSAGSALADELDDNSLSALANRLIQKNLGLGPDPVKGVGTHLHAKMVEGVPVVTIQLARVVEEAQLLPFGRELRDLAERPTLKRLILNFRHVKEFSREAAEKLLAFHERVSARGATLKFCEVSPKVLRQLERARLTDLVSVHLDVNDALWSSW
jgi:anti-anti-sigma regulatory factor